jgi:hypothetical protein
MARTAYAIQSMNGMSKWIVMAGLVASATLGVRSVSQAADPLVDHGALESVAGPLAKILVLKIEGERLRLDRDAWAAPFGGKSIAQLEKEIDEEIRRRGLPLEWYRERNFFALSPRTHVQAHFYELAKAAGSVASHTSRDADWEERMRGSKLEGSLKIKSTAKGEATSFHLELIESESPKRTLVVDEAAAGMLNLILVSESNDYVFRFKQYADARCLVHEFRGTETFSARGADFGDLCRKQPQFIRDRLLPLWRRLGVGVPNIDGAADTKAKPPEPQ